jgi:hypothetical protein
MRGRVVKEGRKLERKEEMKEGAMRIVRKKSSD